MSREYYYNDAGQQIEKLRDLSAGEAKEIARRACAFPEDGYRGEYIVEIAQRHLDQFGPDLSDIERIRHFMRSRSCAASRTGPPAFGANLTATNFESSSKHRRPRRRHGAKLVASGKTYEHEGALAAHHRPRRRSGTASRKSDGAYTYCARRRVSRHQVVRGFPKVINVQGSDQRQHGHARARGPQALGWAYLLGYPDYVLQQRW